MSKPRIPPIYQNLIVGTSTVMVVAYVLHLYFLKSQGPLFWVLFLFMGPLIGYLSGRERQRVSALSKEKNVLAGSMDKMQTQLKQTSQKYDLMIENLSDAIFLTTEDGRFIFFNKALSLLSGYPSQILKGMKLSQLMIESGKGDTRNDALVDNGIHRYEDSWKTQTGSRVYVEISAKWLKIAGKQLILYSARDIHRRKQDELQHRKHEIIAVLKQKQQEIAISQYALYQKILAPQTRTVGLLKTVAEKYDSEKERISGTLGEWAIASKFIGNLMEKNVRDMEPSRRTWDLNAVLEQELDYLQKLTPLREFSRQTWYAPDLPAVSAFGVDLSIAFGSMVKATLLSMEPPRRREISVTTHLRNNQILIEIKAPSAVHFYQHLLAALDPGYGGEGKGEKQFADALCIELFKAFGAMLKIEAGESQGAVIHVQINPQIRQKIQSIQYQEPQKPTSQFQGDDPVVI